MKKTVTAGMRNTTIDLDGTECPVKFSANYCCFEVLNDSDDDVYMSIYQGKKAGEDGVITVHSGMVATLAHMRTDIDTVYITGSGTVQLAAKNTAAPVFKVRSRGGESKPSAKDYIQDGLIAEWVLDERSVEILTNPLFVTDDVLGRSVGKVVNGVSPSFFVKKTEFEYTENDGITLQCLVNIDPSIAQLTDFFTVGENHGGYGSNVALGIGMDNSGKLLVTMPSDDRTINYTLLSDTWYHLAIVYKNDLQVSILYVNGNEAAAVSKGLQIPRLMSGAAIGTWVWSSVYPQASSSNRGNFRIANCCVYDRPLTISEILTNYEADKKRYGI